MEFFFGINKKMTIWSTFHICFLFFNIILTTVLIFLFRKCKPLTLRIVVGVALLTIIGLEIGKQINWGYQTLTIRKFNKLNLSVFPFAICSLPYYIWPLFIFLPECKFRQVISVLIGVYIFFPALGFQFYPGTLCTRVYINHQTMIHHGLQLSISLLIFVHEFEKFTFKKFLWSSLIMVLLGGVAVILNIILTNKGGNVNLWELNPVPGHETTSPVYKDVYNLVPFPIYFIIYMILFSGVGAFSYFLVGFIVKIIKKNQKKNALKGA